MSWRFELEISVGDLTELQEFPRIARIARIARIVRIATDLSWRFELKI